jgi:putative tryptophan/tyrosine transport system substrate-binding protein
MRRREFIRLLAGAAAARPFAAWAQQRAKIYRIGNLTPGPVAPRLHFYATFRQALRELGYVEGQHYVIELRSAEGQYDKLPALAAELVRLDVDVIVAATEPAVSAAQLATNRIPIVMVSTLDPILSGFVTSLARPGGNITGLTKITGELVGKRLELFKEMVPGISRVALLQFPPPFDQEIIIQLKDMEVAAKRLEVQLLHLEVRGPDDFESAFKAARAGADGMIVLDDPRSFSYAAQLVDMAAKYKLPALYGFKEFANSGGLIVYGPNLNDQWYRAAAYVDKILKGTKPGDLPVEQPTRFDLIVNPKTAESLGLTIPPPILIQAEDSMQPGKQPARPW